MASTSISSTSAESELSMLRIKRASTVSSRYVGSLFVNASSRPSDFLLELRTLAGFHADEEIKLYEEIRFEPLVLCKPINIQDTFSSAEIGTGDIICYQKSSKLVYNYCYPYVGSFLQHNLVVFVLDCIYELVICIFQEIMNYPHVAADGFTYEAEAIRRWLDEGNSRSPMTNLVLPNQDLIPNRALRSSIHDHLQLQRKQGQLDS
ncbi:hypothetical protein BAE44_0002122 [Dichanthelium oligosanthes]|uniref:U-box domain-containing protein n=1 Tax=Dichanthelium oligosanthes TaxID=888268 RepID=A0A1E5WIA7_9POAL|nr:hypothetical protein BAE44_0002122 [Dichanthelium oligosanthes]